MRINIFEGARRIALLFGGLWVAGCLAFGFLDDLRWRLHYAISLPGAKPKLVTECAGWEAAKQDMEREAPDGETIPITLCFTPSRADNGEMLVPFRTTETPGYYRMADKYSSEVTEYTKATAAAFRLPTGAKEDAKAAWRAALMERTKTVLAFLFGGLGVGFTLVTGIGWIARGFLGIPRGMDAAAHQEVR